MRQQTDVVRADVVDERLTRYATAIFDVTDKCISVTPPDKDETFEDAKKRLTTYLAAFDDPTLKHAMMDAVLGGDKEMISLLLICCRQYAVGRVYNRREAKFENMVWPLYMVLSKVDNP